MPETATKYPVLTETLNRNGLDTSGKMLAILGCIAGVAVTDPAIAELTITSDGYLLARHDGEIGFNEFIGSANDLDRNLNGVCDVLEVSDDERKEILTAIHRW